jgi:hypothetical protein
MGGLEPALAAERDGQLALFSTRDFAEGTAAFRGCRAAGRGRAAWLGLEHV